MAQIVIMLGREFARESTVTEPPAVDTPNRATGAGGDGLACH
jgi:hypothetical protein